MQEMLEYVQDEVQLFGSARQILISKIKEMLEKEKEVMVEFAQDFEVSIHPHRGRTIQPDELFDETFSGEEESKDVVCSECGSEDEVQISAWHSWKMYCKNCCPVRNAKTTI